MNKIITAICTLSLLAATAFGQAHNVIALGITDEISSVQLAEKRVLNIYLPDGYKKSDTLRYPVIYLLDGGVDEDFIHVAGLVQFNSFTWVNRLPPCIIVGITNTDRKRDMTFPTTVKADKAAYPTTGGSAKFIAFIEKELQPYIQAHYNTNGQKTLIGESLAGLLATEVLLTKPYLFNKYIIISPSLWWDNASLLKRSMVSPSSATNVYIGVGKEGLAPTAEPHVMEVDANVLAEKIQDAKNSNMHLYFDYLPQETHATISHQAIMNAFRILNGNDSKR